MNVADSSRLSRALDSLGLSPASDVNQADLIILNTCVVRQSAEDRALGRLNSLKPLKLANPKLMIGLMGCLIGIHGNQALEKRFPWVDVFAAPSDPEPFLRALENRLEHESSEAWRRQVDEVLDDEFGLRLEEAHTVSENLPIVLGCSHACTYCVIPSKRGREQSRDPKKSSRKPEAWLLAEQENWFCWDRSLTALVLILKAITTFHNCLLTSQKSRICTGCAF